MTAQTKAQPLASAALPKCVLRPNTSGNNPGLSAVQEFRAGRDRRIDTLRRIIEFLIDVEDRIEHASALFERSRFDARKANEIIAGLDLAIESFTAAAVAIGSRGWR